MNFAEKMRDLADKFPEREAAREKKFLDECVESCRKIIKLAAIRGEMSVEIRPSFFVESRGNREVRVAGAVSEVLEEEGFEVVMTTEENKNNVYPIMAVSW